MADWARDHKVAVLVSVIGAIAVIVAAIITGFMQLDGGTKVDQKTGRDGTVCVNAKC